MEQGDGDISALFDLWLEKRLIQKLSVIHIVYLRFDKNILNNIVSKHQTY